MLYSYCKLLIYGGDMPFRKVLVFTVFAVVLVSDANAIKVNDYSITLTDDPKLDELYIIKMNIELWRLKFCASIITHTWPSLG